MWRPAKPRISNCPLQMGLREERMELLRTQKELSGSTCLRTAARSEEEACFALIRILKSMTCLLLLLKWAAWESQSTWTAPEKSGRLRTGQLHLIPRPGNLHTSNLLHRVRAAMELPAIARGTAGFANRASISWGSQTSQPRR